MEKSTYNVRLILLGLSCIVASCASCSQQGVEPEPEPEQPLRLLWSFGFSQQVDGLSLVTLRPEVIDTSSVVVGVDRQYTSLSPDNGSVLWQQQIPDNKANYVNILNHDGHYLYGKNHKSTTYFAIDLQDGSLSWKKQYSEGTFYQYPRDGNNASHIYLSGRKPEVYVFSKTGAYEQTVLLENRARVINATNERLYISQAWKPTGSESAHSRIISFDKQTHKINWSYETTAGGFYYADLVLRDGVLYSGTTSGPSVFVALDAATGAVQWEHTDLQTFRFTMGDGKVFINDGQYIVALDQENGKELWRQDFTYATTSNVAYLDGYVYHAHNGGAVCDGCPKRSAYGRANCLSRWFRLL